jgi:hypothetical protein
MPSFSARARFLVYKISNIKSRARAEKEGMKRRLGHVYD